MPKNHWWAAEKSKKTQYFELQYYEIEKRPWKDCVKLAGLDTSSGKLAHNKLEKLKNTMTTYNFGNRSYK